MFHTVVQQGFLRNGKKYYVYFIDNLLFATAENFQNWLTVDAVIAKSFDTTFFSETQCILNTPVFLNH